MFFCAVSGKIFIVNDTQNYSIESFEYTNSSALYYFNAIKPILVINKDLPTASIRIILDEFEQSIIELEAIKEAAKDLFIHIVTRNFVRDIKQTEVFEELGNLLYPNHDERK